MPFQFFPSCFLPPVRQGDGLPALALRFQFFPSCFPRLRRLDERRHALRPFNSFPVASEGFVPGLAYKVFLFP